MAWQQQGSVREATAREAASSATGRQGATVMGQVWTSLDGFAYLVAFFLVDALTFGPAPAVPSSPPPIKSRDEPTSPTGSSTSSASSWGAPRRSASEGGEVPARQPRVHAHPRRSSNFSDGALLHPSSSASSGGNGERELRSRDDRPSRTLHHYQKKLFSKQVERTLLIQPFVKCLVLALAIALVAVLWMQVFGAPQLVSAAAQAVGEGLVQVWAALAHAILHLYTTLMAAAPARRVERTGWQALVSHWRFFLSLLRIR